MHETKQPQMPTATSMIYSERTGREARIDENLSRRLVIALSDAGHDAIHVAELGLESAPDHHMLQAATGQDRVIVSADRDFGAILAETQATTPSMILVRRISNRRVEEPSALISPTSKMWPNQPNREQ